MPAPIPISFYQASTPQTQPESVQELLNQIAASLGTTFDPDNYVIGQMGGILPDHDVGPWANNAEWWFWDASVGGYVRGFDGVEPGTIMIWGGQGTPTNWLVCDGSERDRTTYQTLFQAIGTDWGGGNGVSTFNLPPGNRIYIADGQFSANSLVPLDGSFAAGWRAPTPHGWGVQGGAQVAPPLAPNNLPPIKVTITFTQPAKKQPGVYGIDNLQPATQTGAQAFIYQVTDPLGTPLQAALQTQFSIMPPFAAANYIIKYQ